jgi:uncharacterized protein YndB with AHSA1/START domain
VSGTITENRPMNVKPNTLFTCATRGSVTINCPVEHVWHVFVVDFPKWSVSVKSAELLKGEWDREGGVVRVTKYESVGLSPMILENLRVKPYTQIVYKADSEQGDEVHGFLDVTFVDLGGKTIMTYSNYVTYKNIFENLSQCHGDEADASMKANFLALCKDFAEKTYADPASARQA